MKNRITGIILLFLLLFTSPFSLTVEAKNTASTVNSASDRYTLEDKTYNITAYSFRNERHYGFYNTDTIDFEGYYGIDVATSGKKASITAYSHISSDTTFQSVEIDYIKDAEKHTTSIKNLGKLIEDATISYTFTSGDAQGIYQIKATPASNNLRAIYGYVYYDGKTAKACRVTNEGINMKDYDAFQKLMADADPKDYLSNELITYPTSGTGDHVTHVKAFEDISDELVINDKWSDEVKVLAFTDYIVKNYAYDEYRVSTLNMVSRANKAGVYNDDSYYALGNHVGVCWDFTNMMVIMCRHHGIPATSVENDVHTAVAVYLNGEWSIIDVTPLTKYECVTLDTDKSKWRPAPILYYSSHNYGCFSLGEPITSHDTEVWTAEAISEHAKR